MILTVVVLWRLRYIEQLCVENIIEIFIDVDLGLYRKWYVHSTHCQYLVPLYHRFMLERFQDGAFRWTCSNEEDFDAMFWVWFRIHWNFVEKRTYVFASSSRPYLSFFLFRKRHIVISFRVKQKKQLFKCVA